MSEQGYERRDANTRGVWLFVAGLAVMVALVCGGVVLLLHWFGGHATHGAGPHLTPPGPVLQATPREDLAVYLQREQHLLESYGWNDAQKSSVHIPIARAMELVAQRGVSGGKAMTPLEMQEQKAKEHTP